MSKLENLIKKFADRNQKVDYPYIMAHFSENEIQYSDEKCEELLALCDKYNVEFPEIYRKHGDKIGHYDYIYNYYYYGYIKITYDFYISSVEIKPIVNACKKYDKLLKINQEVFISIYKSDRRLIADDITTTGEDAIIADDGEKPESAVDNFEETYLDALIEYANTNGEEKDKMVINMFSKFPVFSEFKKIIVRSKSAELQRRIIREYLSAGPFHNVLMFLIKIRRDNLLPELECYINELSEDKLCTYLRDIPCKKMAHALFAAYGIDKINYRIISCILMNKKLGYPMMNELMRIIKNIKK